MPSRSCTIGNDHSGPKLSTSEPAAALPVVEASRAHCERVTSASWNLARVEWLQHVTVAQCRSRTAAAYVRRELSAQSSCNSKHLVVQIKQA
eukprot:SM000874S23669  [mRNA]  locus=s874:1161:1436:+ [translate_table: standard]